MENLNRLFEELKKDLRKPGVFIKEISSDEIEGKGYKKGYVLPFVSNNEYKYFEIYVDESLNYDEKLSIIFHEMGHIKLNESLGFYEVDLQIKNDREKWTTYTEFQAYKNQLEEGKKLFERGITSVLSIIIESINDTYNDSNIIIPYKVAIEEIFKDNIWIECNKLFR